MNVALSVVICSHNPRAEYLQRTLGGLKAQTLDRSRWELLLVDNNSRVPLSEQFAVSWHPHARHVREEEPGLTPARLRGIAESGGELLVFVDDDNVLAPDYLQQAHGLRQAFPRLGAFGAGVLDPEFEVSPPPQLQPWLSMLALRTISAPQTSERWIDKHCIPWGAGLCVSRTVAAAFTALVRRLNTSALGRSGERLFCGEDDLFSFVACEKGGTFGVFPELRVQHLIAARRLTEDYILRLVHDHTYSHTVLNYLLLGTPPGEESVGRPRTLLHGLRRGWFSMKCRVAEERGRAAAAQFLRQSRLHPLEPEAAPACEHPEDGGNGLRRPAERL